MAKQKMKLTNSYLSVGNKVIYLRNVTETSVWKKLEHRKIVKKLILIGLAWLFVSVLVFSTASTVYWESDSISGLALTIGGDKNSAEFLRRLSFSLLMIPHNLGNIILLKLKYADMLSYAAGMTIIISVYFIKPTYELRLQTNSGLITPFLSRNRTFIHEIADAITDAIAHPQHRQEYFINVENQTINKIENSTVKGYVGGNAENTKQNVDGDNESEG